jgi:hypothetical protein
MNKQTKAYRKLGLSTVNGGASTSVKKFEIFEGAPCVTDFSKKDKNPQNKRKSAKDYSKVTRSASMAA